MTSMLGNMTSQPNKAQMEERMACLKDDPSLKPILDEIETDGPSAMMKYEISVFFSLAVCVICHDNLIGFYFLGTGMILRSCRN